MNTTFNSLTITFGRKFTSLKSFCNIFGVKTTPRKSLFRLTPDETISVVSLVGNSVSDSGWRNTKINLPSPKTGEVNEASYIIWSNKDRSKVASETQRYSHETNHKYVLLMKDTPQDPYKFMGIYLYEPRANNHEICWRRVSKELTVLRDEDGNPIKISGVTQDFYDIAG